MLLANHVTVAVVDQVQPARDASPGKLVKRAVTRLITPGTASDHALLDPNHNSFLAALVVKAMPAADVSFGFAYADVSTGEFRATEARGVDAIRRLLAAVAPSELLVVSDKCQQLLKDAVEKEIMDAGITLVSETHAISQQAAQTILCQFYHIDHVESIGCHEREACTEAAAVLLSFVTNTITSEMTDRHSIHLNRLVTFSASDTMTLDASCIRNLEVLQTTRARNNQLSLEWAIDRTVSSMGSRCLRSWILNPLMSVDTIVARQSVIEAFVNHVEDTVGNVQKHIRSVADFERLGGRVCSARASPREMRCLCQSVAILPDLFHHVHTCLMSQPRTESSHAFFEQITAEVDQHLMHLVSKVLACMMDPAPVTIVSEMAISSGGVSKENLTYSAVQIFCAGYNPELDRLRQAVEEPDVWISELETKERSRSQIDSLRIKHIKNTGYVVRVPRSVGEKRMNDEPLLFSKLGYDRVQGTKAELRFRFKELKVKEKEHFSALSEAMLLELRLFEELRKDMMIHIDTVRRVGRQVAAIDVLAGLAEVARTQRYCKPNMLPSSDRRMKIVDGRHAVVEQTLPVGTSYVPNTFSLGDVEDESCADVMVLCGPNAAGKSCALRSIGLIAILAQIGSFVPAQYAELSICDRIFTRVGAVDDVAKGQSTFQVEMAETACILSHATSSSIVLLDEIGRGTSSRDGIAIAWSVAEYLANGMKEGCARTLFVTHYHELNYLADVYKNVKAFHLHMEHAEEYQVDAEKRNPDDDIYKWITTYRIVSGASFNSMGLAIAKRAGFPDTVLRRAEDIGNLLRNPFRMLGDELKSVLSGDGGIEMRDKVESESNGAVEINVDNERSVVQEREQFGTGFANGYAQAIADMRKGLDKLSSSQEEERYSAR